LNARGLGDLLAQLSDATEAMANATGTATVAAMAKYSKIEERFQVAGGYAAEAQGAAIASNLGIEERILSQPLKTLSGGQRRRIELARILFSSAQTMLLDEPTNHLDADSVVWLRDFLKSYQGGLIVISHDIDLVETTVNRVFYLDANRQMIDIYNMGWKAYQKQREADEERRKRERANAEKKAASLSLQAAKFGAKATKAVAAQQMARRAQRLLDNLEDIGQTDRVAKIRFPDPAPCGKTPLMASGLSKSYGSLEIFAAVDLAIDKGSKVVIIGLNGAGKTTLLRILAGIDKPDTGQIEPGHGLKIGYYAQEHETLDISCSVLENMQRAAPHLGDVDTRKVLGSFLFTGDDVNKKAAVLSGGEKTRLALAALVVSSANVLLLDEPTNNLDPASRTEILNALASFTGAVVLVSHDEGAVLALNPERVLILPDGTEDHWSDEYADLIALS
jgi:ATPase subunit of ABC transporter with duplicated ATPase domains